MGSPFIVVTDPDSVPEGKLVRDVMEKFLATDHPTLRYLKAQYVLSTITSIEYSGYGIFANFDVSSTAYVLPEFGRQVLCLDIYGDVVGDEGGVGFVLFIEDGKLCMLECIPESSDVWPSLTQGYRLVESHRIIGLPIPELPRTS